MARIFISHSSRDGAQSQRMRDWLAEQGFEQAFLDFDKHVGIPPGADWEKTLYTEIAAAQAVILILTPNWIDSKWCFAEFTQARALGKAIFPVIEAPTDQTFIAPDIQRLDLLEDREGGLERLDKALSDVALEAQGGFELPVGRSPYPGLSAFDEDDAAIYFGRDDDIRRVIETLRSARTHGQPRLIAMLGASGSGKSSLLRAGVLPRLKRDRGSWLVTPPFRPGRRPTRALAEAFAATLETPAEVSALESALLGDPSAALADIASQLRTAAGRLDTTIVVCLDQAEELFGLTETEAVGPFLCVLEVLSDQSGPYVSALTLRSEFLGSLQRTQVTFEEISIGPMPVERVPQIVEGPAAVVGLTIEDGLATRMATDAETEDALPLLAFTLRELHERYGTDGRLTLEEYARLGDAGADLSPIENSVRQAAEGVIKHHDPGPDELAALREAFVGDPALVRVKDDGFVRSRAEWTKLPAASRPLLQALQDAHLLGGDEEDGEKVVEVTHEALFRTWPLLSGWLGEEREFLTWRQRLGETRLLFVDGKRGLLVGRELEIARGWQEARPTTIGSDDLAFIEQSADAAETERLAKEAAARRTLRRTQVFAGVVVALLILAVGAGFLAIQASDVADAAREDALEKLRVAEVRRVATLATTLSTREPELAMLLSIWALGESADLSRSDSFEARDAAIRIQADQLYLGRHLGDHEANVSGVAFAPADSEAADYWLLSTDVGGAIKSWSRAGEALEGIAPAEGTPGHRAIAVSPTGDRIATAGCHKQGASPGGCQAVLSLWTPDLLERTELIDRDLPDPAHVDTVYTLAFSPDGQLLASGSRAGGIVVWDVADGEPEFGPLVANDTCPAATKNRATHRSICRVNDVAFSADGRMVASSHGDTTVRLWSTPDPRALTTWPPPDYTVPLEEFAGSSAVAFGPDGRFLAYGGQRGSVMVRDMTNDRIQELFGHAVGIDSLTFGEMEGRRLLASGDTSGLVRIWELGDDGDQQTWAGWNPELRGHIDRIEDLAFSSDGRVLATGSRDDSVILWRLDAQDATRHRLARGVLESSRSAAFQPGGDTLAIGQNDGRVALVDPADPAASVAFLDPYAELDACTGPCRANDIAFSPDGGVMAVSQQNGTVSLWDAAAWERLDIVVGAHPSPRRPISVDINADGTRLASASQFEMDGLIIWDIGERRLARQTDYTASCAEEDAGALESLGAGLGACAVFGLEFSPFDPDRLITGNVDGVVLDWTIPPGEIPRTVMLFQEDEDVGAIASSPTEPDLFAVGFADGRLQLHRGRGMVRELVTPSRIRDLTFSADGDLLLTVHDDGTVRIWDVAVGRSSPQIGRGLRSCEEFRNCRVLRVAVNPTAGSMRLATTASDGSATVWDLGQAGLERAACLKAGRTLTEVERKESIGASERLVCEGTDR